MSLRHTFENKPSFNVRYTAKTWLDVVIVIDFHSKLLELDWDDVYRSDDVNTALSSLHFTLKRVMDECFPSKTMRMSSRDPPWMNPLVKTQLKKKANLQTSKRGECLVNLSERINAWKIGRHCQTVGLDPNHDGKKSTSCQRGKNRRCQRYMRIFFRI